MSKLANLQSEWNQQVTDKTALEKATEQYGIFRDWIDAHWPDDERDIELDNYTNLLGESGKVYFTNLMEKGTEKCGRFGSSSSFAYGVYRIKEEIGQKYFTAQQRRDKNKTPADTAEAAAFFRDKVLPVLKKLRKLEDISPKELWPLDVNYARKIAYMFNPGELLPIFKRADIEVIADCIGASAGEEFDPANYKATAHILNLLKDQGWNRQLNGFELTQELGNFLREKFANAMPLKHKNVIFYGAPGTGKTYKVESIKKLILLDKGDESEELEFAQFHPSYTYEDFIEGLKPVNGEKGIELKLEAGQFKRFCKKAADSLRKSRMRNEEPKKYYFVADEINRAELSRVLGEVLVCLEESKRIDYDSAGELKPGGLCVKTQYGHRINTAEDAVVTVTTHGKQSYFFAVPSNLYFIGTMNEVDRSIESFDMALRRRFVWQRMECDYSVIKEELAMGNADAYADLCAALNDFICNQLELGSAYEIGHAYFLAIQDLRGKNSKRDITDSDLDNLFELKVRPLLKEYIRSEFSESVVEAKLEAAKAIFSFDQQKKRGVKRAPR